MSIKAVYENGVLRPLEPVDLRENERVEVDVHRRKPPVLLDAESSAIDALCKRWGKKRFGMPASDFDETPPGLEEYI